MKELLKLFIIGEDDYYPARSMQDAIDDNSIEDCKYLNEVDAIIHDPHTDTTYQKGAEEIEEIIHGLNISLEEKQELFANYCAKEIIETTFKSHFKNRDYYLSFIYSDEFRYQCSVEEVMSDHKYRLNFVFDVSRYGLSVFDLHLIENGDFVNWVFLNRWADFIQELRNIFWNFAKEEEKDDE